MINIVYGFQWLVVNICMVNNINFKLILFILIYDKEDILQFNYLCDKNRIYLNENIK